MNLEAVNVIVSDVRLYRGKSHLRARLNRLWRLLPPLPACVRALAPACTAQPVRHAEDPEHAELAGARSASPRRHHAVAAASLCLAPEGFRDCAHAAEARGRQHEATTCGQEVGQGVDEVLHGWEWVRRAAGAQCARGGVRGVRRTAEKRPRRRGRAPARGRGAAGCALRAASVSCKHRSVQCETTCAIDRPVVCVQKAASGRVVPQRSTARPPNLESALERSPAARSPHRWRRTAAEQLERPERGPTTYRARTGAAGRQSARHRRGRRRSAPHPRNT